MGSKNAAREERMMKRRRRWRQREVTVAVAEATAAKRARRRACTVFCLGEAVIPKVGSPFAVPS